MSKNVAVNVMSQEQVRELFTYEDGELYWKVRPAQGVFPGDKAGGWPRRGYLFIIYRGKDYKLHNLVWNYHRGDIPKGKTIDHKDRNRLNNRIENLRPATPTQQQRNKLVRGIRRTKNPIRPWETRISIDGKRKSLGYFPTALQGILAYEKKAMEIDPEFSVCAFTEVINQLLRH